jgi:hypothetical protein
MVLNFCFSKADNFITYSKALSNKTLYHDSIPLTTEMNKNVIINYFQFIDSITE